MSKLEAEEKLKSISQESGLETVILRPPLVYGAGVRANFLQLISLVNKGLPLPFGSISNRRSFIYVGNLVDAIARCVDHPRAKNEVFFVSDGAPVSTPDLVRKIGSALKKRVAVFRCPQRLLKLMGTMVGKRPAIQRLVESLVVDDSKIRSTLGWSNPYSFEEGLKETIQWYRSI
jgi:nucleoside-diphosphate-sugar epimerase